VQKKTQQEETIFPTNIYLLHLSILLMYVCICILVFISQKIKTTIIHNQKFQGRQYFLNDFVTYTTDIFNIQKILKTLYDICILIIVN
jgi:hypothetical protein